MISRHLGFAAVSIDSLSAAGGSVIREAVYLAAIVSDFDALFRNIRIRVMRMQEQYLL